jgi:hypothetical protein
MGSTSRTEPSSAVPRRSGQEPEEIIRLAGRAWRIVRATDAEFEDIDYESHVEAAEGSRSTDPQQRRPSRFSSTAQGDSRRRWTNSSA